MSSLKAGRALKRASKRKRRSKTIPALGAAGLSLTLASEASLAATAPAFDTMTRKAGVNHEIILREDEIFDVSLATFTFSTKKELEPPEPAGGSSRLPDVVSSRAWRDKPRPKTMPIRLLRDVGACSGC